MKKSNHYGQDPTHEKRERAEADELQSRHKCGTTTGITAGGALSDEINGEIDHEQQRGRRTVPVGRGVAPVPPDDNGNATEVDS